MRLTVYFDGQYWVGVAEDTDCEPPVVIRHIFGAEPQDAEVARFVNERLFVLIAEAAHAAQTSQSGVSMEDDSVRPRSPKRRAREAAAAVRERGISTRAQVALQQQYEARKVERQARARDAREAEIARKWALKHAKAKERHRGH